MRFLARALIDWLSPCEPSRRPVWRRATARCELQRRRARPRRRTGSNLSRASGKLREGGPARLAPRASPRRAPSRLTTVTLDSRSSARSDTDLPAGRRLSLSLSRTCSLRRDLLAAHLKKLAGEKQSRVLEGETVFGSLTRPLDGVGQLSGCDCCFCGKERARARATNRGLIAGL